MNGVGNGQNAIGTGSSVRQGGGGGQAENRGGEKQPQPQATLAGMNGGGESGLTGRSTDVAVQSSTFDSPSSGGGGATFIGDVDPSERGPLSSNRPPTDQRYQPRQHATPIIDTFIAPAAAPSNSRSSISNFPSPVPAVPSANSPVHAHSARFESTPRVPTFFREHYPVNLPSPSPSAPAPSSNNSHVRSTTTSKPTQNQTEQLPRYRVPSAPQPSSSNAPPRAPVQQTNSTEGRQLAISFDPRPQNPERLPAHPFYILNKEMSGATFKDLFMQVRAEILRIATTGGIRLEAELETGETMPALVAAKLPTSRVALEKYRPYMQRLMPGLVPEDYLATFERWHDFTLRSGDATFPICGPTVADFLRMSTNLDAGARQKLVFVLEQYRKVTIKLFEKASRDSRVRERMKKFWNSSDWDIWDKYIELAKIRLGDWKVIEETAPPLRPPRSARSTPASSNNASLAPVVPSTSANQRTFDPSRPDDLAQIPSRPNSRDSHTNPVQQPQPPPDVPSTTEQPHSYGFDRHGNPRKRPLRKRKLPPDERKADEEFHVAVRECSEALDRAKERLLQDDAEGSREAQVAGSASTAAAQTENRSEQVNVRRPRPASPSPPAIAPWSDYLPLSQPPRYQPTQGITAYIAFTPETTLSISLPHSIPTLYSTRYPLQSLQPSLVLTSTGLIPDPSQPLPLPSLSLNPSHFLPYPRSLVLPSTLSSTEQSRALQFAKGLEEHPNVVAENENANEELREWRKQIALEKIVTSAISQSQPLGSSLMLMGKEGEKERSREPREPEGARRARERARRNGVEPVYCFPRSMTTTTTTQTTPVSATTVGETVVEKENQAKIVERVEKEKVPSEAEKSHKVSTVDRKGKRKASEIEEEETREVSTSEKSQSAVPEIPPAASPRMDVPQSAPIVPTQSISTPAPAHSLSKSLPASASSTIVSHATTSHHRRPSLTSSSVSAPIVPQQQVQRSRSKSVSQEPPTKMRRRTSITNSSAAVHPLAHLYASQNPQFRQGARIKAANIVAATKSGIIPAAKSPLIAAKVLSEGAVLPKGSPRIGLGLGGIGGSNLAQQSPRTKPLSPPLVPLPLQAEKETTHHGGVDQTAVEASKDPEAMDVDSNENDQLQTASVSSAGSSALGVILELPSPHQQSQTTTATRSPGTTNPSPARADPIPPIPIPPVPQDSSTPPTASSSLNPSFNGAPIPTVTSSSVQPSTSLDSPSTTSNDIRSTSRGPPSAKSATKELAVDEQAERRKSKGKDKEPSIDPAPPKSPSKRSSLMPSKSPSKELRKSKEPSLKPASKEKGKNKPKVTIEIVPPPPPKMKRDHPLRHVSKQLLAVSDPVFPFGRSKE
ncbi:uncharacterized protein JCM6883_005107 [Sporobolomyces salmoneus]|uniref:uncharacterized protein n=1 Tax=Sporobolomyces salmoneus TaxID=183962 RepID=UPI00317C6FB4